MRLSVLTPGILRKPSPLSQTLETPNPSSMPFAMQAMTPNSMQVSKKTTAPASNAFPHAYFISTRHRMQRELYNAQR